MILLAGESYYLYAVAICKVSVNSDINNTLILFGYLSQAVGDPLEIIQGIMLLEALPDQNHL